MKTKYIVFLLLLSLATHASTMYVPVVIVSQHTEKAPNHLSLEWLYELIQYSPDSIETKEVRENLSYYTRMVEFDIKCLEVLRESQDSVQNQCMLKGLMKTVAFPLLFTGACLLAASHRQPYYYFNRDEEDFYFGCASILAGIGIFFGATGARDVVNALQYTKDLNERLQKDRRILRLLNDIAV